MTRRDEKAVFDLCELYERYGYYRFKMNRFEEYELYVSNKDFLISDEIITFTDRSGRLMAMKPDVTLSIIKNAPDNKGEVQKVYYNESVYRVASGSKSFKEIMQTGLECVGDLTEYDIVEAVLLAAQSLNAIDKSFVLDISHMGLISVVLENSGLGEKSSEEYLKLLQSKNSGEIKKLCENENISESQSRKLIALVDYYGSCKEVIEKIYDVLTEENEKNAADELATLTAVLECQKLEGKINIDFSVGNDLKYYSGVVFKGYISGIPVSVLSGGQYDKLLRKMDKKSNAIGFAVYTQLLQQLDNGSADSITDSVIIYSPKDNTVKLVEATQSLLKSGSVLVTTAMPAGKKAKNVYRYENGEVTLIENNG